MSDIVERLRSWVYTDSLYATAREAADEIERLRSRLRFCDAVIRSGDVAALTDSEREAIERGYCSLMGVEDMSAECSRWDSEAADTLRGLLERLK